MKVIKYCLVVLSVITIFVGIFVPTITTATTVSAVWERTIETSQFSSPSPDPVGIVYIPNPNPTQSGTLLISDSEIEESPAPYYTGKNLFEVSLEGDLLGMLTTMPFVLTPTEVYSPEPTDLAYDPLSKKLFISDDNWMRVFVLNPESDGDYNTEDDTVTYFRTSLFGSTDPEGIAFDSARGHLFLADGSGEEIYDIAPGANGVFDGVPTTGDDQVTHFDTTGLSIWDPEGIEFNPDNGHLYIMSTYCNYIAETTIDGTLVRYINISTLKTNHGASLCGGLAYAPSSSDPGQMNLYIVARGADNSTDPNENDGKLYEISFPPLGAEVNQPPVATAKSVTTTANTTIAITLKGTDPDGDPLTYSVVTQPAHGTLSGSAPNLTYTPGSGYTGSDSFTFKVNDGTADSATATVTITVTAAVNNQPVANAQSVTTAEDTTKAITLTGSDADGDPLAYSVVTQPTHGTLSGSAPNLTYTPTANYSGSDSFTFKVNDGKADSNIATVSITVTAVNDPPVADSKSVTTTESNAVAITLTGSDADGDPLAYSVVASPAHGTLSGSAPNLTYTPASGYSGSDSFTFKVNDGKVDSNIATVSITVTAVNDPPVADSKSVTTTESNAVAITLTGSDADGDPLAYSVVASPAHGTLSGSAPNLIYTPAPGYNGSDSFTFKVNDGKVDSNIATVALTVTAVNDPPVANAQSVTTAANRSTAITLTGGDPDGDALTYSLVNSPTYGALSGTAPNLTYTPYSLDYTGSDSFTFTVNDGKLDSIPAMVFITITAPINQAPVVNAGSDETILLSDSAPLVGSAMDDGLPNPPATLTYTWSKVSGPGTVAFDNVSSPSTTATFSRAGGYTLRLTVSDNQLSSSDDVVVSVRKK